MLSYSNGTDNYEKRVTTAIKLATVTTRDTHKNQITWVHNRWTCRRTRDI